MAGAAYTAPLERASMSPWLLDVAEEFIFRKVSNLPATPPPKDPATLLSTVQLIQSALIIEMLQFGRDDMQTRRRIRIVRNPCLVSTIRSLGMLQFKRQARPRTCDEPTWRIMVAEEMCIRYVSHQRGVSFPMIHFTKTLPESHAGSFWQMAFLLFASRTTRPCRYSK